MLSQIEAARSEFLLVLPKIAGSFLLKPVSACLSLVRTQVGQGGNVRTWLLTSFSVRFLVSCSLSLSLSCVRVSLSLSALSNHLLPPLFPNAEAPEEAFFCASRKHFWLFPETGQPLPLLLVIIREVTTWGVIAMCQTDTTGIISCNLKEPER